MSAPPPVAEPPPGPQELESPRSEPIGRPTPLAPGTLGRKLVLRVAALVAVAAILLSAATALTTRQLLVSSLDDQLIQTADRIQRGPGGRGGSGGSGSGSGLLQPGQSIGTLSAALTTDGRLIDSGVLKENRQYTPISPQAARELAALGVDDQPSSVSLTGIGHYRVVSYQVTVTTNGTTQFPGVLVVGLPLRPVDSVLLQLIGTEAILSLLVIGGVVLGARSLVERSLRPLNRVAGIAQQVSQLPLDRGEVALAVRVPATDADPTSEVGRVGQAINHMLTNVDGALAARQASEMKVRQFVADASHELRNPLAAIRGYAELTRRGRDDLQPDTAYAMSRVESEAARMSTLVEDLLLLARLDSGPEIDVAPTDLTELVINAVSDARAAGPAHHWALDLPDQPVLALGDRHRLHQVVTNLLANARNHTPEGTRVEVGLGVSDGDQGAQAMITVTDDGPGIPPQLQAQIFERFTRADTSRARSLNGSPVSSTGLGLAIVAAVVEAHHGSVQVESRPGFTRFRVLLPAGADPAGVVDQRAGTTSSS